MKLGIYDERTRIILHLPNNMPDEGRAVNLVIDLLKQRRNLPRGKGSIKGFSQSVSIPSAFEGYWWSSKRRRWVRDNIILVMIDHEFPLRDSRLHPEIDELKKEIAHCYEIFNVPQEEIWIVTHPIWRYD